VIFTGHAILLYKYWQDATMCIYQGITAALHLYLNVIPLTSYLI
jgi:hypothetical protein